LNERAPTGQRAHSPGNAPRRGNEHIAQGRAQRHPGNYTIARIRPERAKALIIRYLQFLYYIYFYAFALAGRGDWRCLNSRVPLRSTLGYVLVAPSGRVHSRRIHPIVRT